MSGYDGKPVKGHKIEIFEFPNAAQIIDEKGNVVTVRHPEDFRAIAYSMSKALEVWGLAPYCKEDYEH